MSEAETAVSVESIDILRIMEMIPHRYPMLLIDRVIDLRVGKSAIGIKNVTINEPQFTGHFPTQPVMPGVMIVEAMAQTAAVVVVHSLGKEAEGKLVYFMTIDEARFRKPVTPGDQMHIHVSAVKQRGPVWKFEGKDIVDVKLAAYAIFSAMILDRK